MTSREKKVQEMTLKVVDFWESKGFSYAEMMAGTCIIVKTGLKRKPLLTKCKILVNLL